VLVPVTEGGASDHLFTPFTSMFLHGDFAHIVGNMWFLHVFGDNVEDALGKARFTAFYFAAGLFAALAQLVVDPREHAADDRRFGARSRACSARTSCSIRERACSCSSRSS
jgi:membrane associated rhomboid family serine protease